MTLDVDIFLVQFMNVRSKFWESIIRMIISTEILNQLPVPRISKFPQIDIFDPSI